MARNFRPSDIPLACNERYTFQELMDEIAPILSRVPVKDMIWLLQGRLQCGLCARSRNLDV